MKSKAINAFLGFYAIFTLFAVVDDPLGPAISIFSSATCCAILAWRLTPNGK